ncbi:hypothetical protein BDY19DRAFT_996107 [Irpex rosettiformis]|uniref:Uncharacterized protein n=1 Tax=Irpex rosettiformis TaxID=378272 RepID=A0ACB8TWH0_9APHY|nr:hypothetical protein BDY19DRAFT_996107 [Irpex rosettiformis]
MDCTPRASYGAVYQTAYRQAEAQLREKTHEEEIRQLRTQHANELRHLVELKATLTTALEEAQRTAEDARQTAEQHRKINANLNLALTTACNKRQALEKERSRLKLSLKEAARKADVLENRNCVLMARLVELDSHLVVVTPGRNGALGNRVEECGTLEKDRGLKLHRSRTPSRYRKALTPTRRAIKQARSALKENFDLVGLAS